MKNISKWLKPVLCFCLSFTLLALSSCKEDDTHIPYSLKTSDNEYVFPAAGGEFTVTVTTDHPDGWEMNFTEAAWISKAAQTDNTVTFKAVENLTGDMPEVKVKFTAGELTKELTITQEPRIVDENVNFFMFLNYIQAISPDGNHIVVYEIEGSQSEGDRVVKYFTINTQTDEKTLMLETRDGDEFVISIRAISNNGVMLGELSAGGLSNDVIIRNGAVEYPKLPGADWKNPALKDISADGTIIVGAATDSSTGSNVTRALKWVNGEPSILSVPTESRVSEGSAIRASYAETISPDGKFIMGRAINNSSSNEGIYWKNAGEWKWLGTMETKMVEMTNMFGETFEIEENFVAIVGPNSTGKISPNSKYVAIHYQDWGLNRWQSPSKVEVPALFDIEKEEITEVIRIVDESPNGGVTVSSLNDGSVCYKHTDFMSGDSPAFLYQDGRKISTQIYLENLFGTLIGPDIEIRMIVDSPLVAVGSFTHPAGRVVSFYMRPITTN
mgnify:CR=1 FL=1